MSVNNQSGGPYAGNFPGWSEIITLFAIAWNFFENKREKVLIYRYFCKFPEICVSKQCIFPQSLVIKI